MTIIGRKRGRNLPVRAELNQGSLPSPLASLETRGLISRKARIEQGGRMSDLIGHALLLRHGRRRVEHSHFLARNVTRTICTDFARLSFVSLRSVRVVSRHEKPSPLFSRLKLRPFLREKLVGAVGIEPTTSPV
jgi:hypothetical protein